MRLVGFPNAFDAAITSNVNGNAGVPSGCRLAYTLELHLPTVPTILRHGNVVLTTMGSLGHIHR